MKKLLEKTDLLAGIFAIIAAIAIICEVGFGGFTKESIVGGIKDITGIVVDVLVLIVAASVFVHKPLNFKEKFNIAIDKIKDKYAPLLIEDKKEGVIRYKIASNADALFINSGKNPERIFELSENKPEEICFYINKSFFGQNGDDDFDAIAITNDIERRLLSVFKSFKYTSNPNKSNYELHIKFEHPIESKDDIDMLVDLIDYTILLFVARNKS